MTGFEVPLFAPAAIRAAELAARETGVQLVCLALVGSITNGEACFSRSPASDIDLLAVVEEPLPVERSIRFREIAVTFLSGDGWSSFRIGLRSRGITELDDFHTHMRSWGYDLYRYPQTLVGPPLASLLKPPSPIPAELVLRNLLGQLWWSVSAKGAEGWHPEDALYAFSRSLLETAHFALLTEGLVFGTSAERLQAIGEGHGPAWLQVWLPALQVARAVRQGSLQDVAPADALQRIASAWRSVFSQVCVWSMRRVASAKVLRLWFPLASTPGSWRAGPLLRDTAGAALGRAAADELARAQRSTSVWWTAAPVLAVLLGLHAALFEQYMTIPELRDDVASPLGSAARALRMLQCARGTDSSFEGLRRQFAEVQLRRCPAARRDLYHHLLHLTEKATPPRGSIPT